MSKLYTKYQELKKKDKEKYYLFEVGVFYLFIDKDAEELSKVLNIKLTNLNQEIKKCGFPKNSLIKYQKRLEEENIKVEIIEKEQKEKKEKKKKTKDETIMKKLNAIDINKITPIDAIYILQELKDKLG